MTGDHAGDGGEVPQEERDDRPELDVDTAFAAIIAHLRDEPAGGVGRWPAAEDLADGDDGTAGTAPEPDDGPEPVREAVLSGPSANLFTAGSSCEVVADDEGYVPPEPPPFPRGDLVSRLAWAGVIGGPLFLLLAAIVWQTLPKMLLLAALAAFVGGFVSLVARMPSEAPDEPDDGAVV
ncbi:hypothetical protein [Kineosporia sp. R_H_3]|uniref:hypothetical protein n=1 Tax=Kineosporia sp. R_H_3 TaxID=1961848 RepID=UPI000B4AEE01|nr:hypothetical protein [Kineosporia sp. R_H_3]